jgi:phosphoribosylaminoimidazole carboxylase (NCAIR synthetase)
MDSYYRDKKQKEDKYKRTLKKALSKGDAEKIKSLRMDYSLNPIDKEKTRYMNETEYLRIIKDKILQKQIYKDSEIPTSDFIITQNKRN